MKNLLRKLGALALCCAPPSIWGNEICADAGTRAETSVYRSEYVQVVGPDAVAIGRECDAILRRLEARYGKPRYWRVFPVRFGAPNGAAAGYTTYVEPNVTEVAIFQSFEESRGGTLDHELTHAFFFYYVNSNFDLMFNEGLAQNSEYAVRARLREQVYVRYRSNELAPLAELYCLNRYDRSLLIYTEGFSVVDFLIARGGSKWFAAFILDLTRSTKDVDRSLLRFYGYRSLSEMESDWRAYIRSGQDRKRVRAIAISRKKEEKE